MSEYLRDQDGDVWRVDPGCLVSHRYNGELTGDPGPSSRDYVERTWGPLVPCTEVGTPLTAEPASDPGRVLVAAAFRELADEMFRAFRRSNDATAEAVFDEVRDAAKAVADLVERGEIGAGE
ncbi:hypothetical protein [Kitasatospora purpeofusca]|uniref:hypothetical protein n=1 Tax=Kitasatospora purpeofusca TaxID=67352 RepID=UPI0036888F66